MDRADGLGGMDLYISFRKQDGSWAQASNMESPINSTSVDTFASLSPDGEWLFFVSGRSGNADVYWVDAQILEGMRDYGQ